MEIKGRECEEIKIGEYVYYFISKYKTKDFRSVLKSSFVKKLKIDDGVVDKKIEIEISELYEDTIPYILEFCLSVKDKDGKLFDITEDFLNDLDSNDFIEIVNKVFDIMMSIAGGEKKVSVQSKK